MQIIPAVDLVGEDATRLVQGDFARELFRRPAEAYITSVAATRPPLIHLVDLDGARSGEVRLPVLARCITAAGDIPVQVAGGIRTPEQARAVIALGVARVVIGTAAFGTPGHLGAFVAEFGDRVAVAIDVRENEARVTGWTSSSGLSVSEAAQRCLDAGVGRVVGTAIASDGTGAGPDVDLFAALCAYGFAVVAAGGVRDHRDVDALAQVGCEGAITGRAFAEGQFHDGA